MGERPDGAEAWSSDRRADVRPAMVGGRPAGPTSGGLGDGERGRAAAAPGVDQFSRDGGLTSFDALASSRRRTSMVLAM
jgi:hypothetical protein